jgi:hypothetical protein
MAKVKVESCSEEKIKEIARGLIAGTYRPPDTEIGSDVWLLGALMKGHKPEDYLGVDMLIDCTRAVRSCNGKPMGFAAILIRHEDFAKAVALAKTLW